MGDLTVEHCGDSLIEINGESLCLESLGENLIFHNGGSELADIICTYSDSWCEYQGDSLWVLDDNISAGVDAIRDKLSAILYEADEAVIDEIIHTYYNGT